MAETIYATPRFTNSTSNVVIIGRTSNSTITNIGDNVTILAGARNDKITNNGSSVIIDVGAGNNTVDNRSSLVTILGGSGNDIIVNTGATVTIDGGRGNDKLYNGATPNGGGVAYYNADYYDGGFSNVVFKHKAGDGNHTIWGFRADSTLEVEGVELTDISYLPDATGNNINVTIGSAQVSLFGSGPNGNTAITNLNISVPKTDTLICDVERIIVEDSLICDVERTVSFGITEQGFEIQFAEQQITETVTFTAAAPFEILQQTAGQFLDYKYNLRIESITQRGILYTCRCCTNLEEILYSQLEYSVPEVSRQQRTWHYVGFGERPDQEERPIKVYDEPERANASGHVEAIAGALGISYKNQFDDFVSTAEVERGGSTYADTIRELFGWSARIPTMLINAFIRDNCLYVIQRGHEEHVIDISNGKITVPVFTRELVRTYWGEQTYINTEVRTVNTIVTGSLAVLSNITDDGVLETWPGQDTESLFNRIHEPTLPLRRTETIETKSGSIHKSYGYNQDGLLGKTVEVSTGSDGLETSKTVTVYEYASFSDDSTLYDTGNNIYLKQETMTIYDKNGVITDKRVITYSPTGTGQAAAVGKTSDGETFLNTVKDIPPNALPSPYATNKTFHDLQDKVPEIEQQKQARQQERLIPGIVPFDTSFPIVGDDKLIEITNAIKDLNRRTKETVTVTLYDYEHLIDFNDRILLYGNEYFLVSNTLTTTPHVRDQQSLVLVRWY